MVPAPGLREGHSAAKHVGSEAHIGVRKDQPIPARVPVGLPERVRLAQPAGWEFAEVNYFQMMVCAGELFEDFRRGISGAVIGGNNFIVRIVLREQGGEGLGELFGFVAGRKKHRDAGTARLKSGGDIGEPSGPTKIGKAPDGTQNPEESDKPSDARNTTPRDGNPEPDTHCTS